MPISNKHHAFRFLWPRGTSTAPKATSKEPIKFRFPTWGNFISQWDRVIFAPGKNCTNQISAPGNRWKFFALLATCLGSAKVAAHGLFWSLRVFSGWVFWSCVHLRSVIVLSRGCAFFLCCSSFFYAVASRFSSVVLVAFFYCVVLGLVFCFSCV